MGKQIDHEKLFNLCREYILAVVQGLDFWRLQVHTRLAGLLQVPPDSLDEVLHNLDEVIGLTESVLDRLQHTDLDELEREIKPYVSRLRVRLLEHNL